MTPAHALAAVVPMDPDRFSLGSRRAAARQAGDERQLKGGHDLVPVGGNEEQLGRVGVDRVEGAPIGLQVRSTQGKPSDAAQGIGGDQADDGRDPRVGRRSWTSEVDSASVVGSVLTPAVSQLLCTAGRFSVGCYR